MRDKCGRFRQCQHQMEDGKGGILPRHNDRVVRDIDRGGRGYRVAIPMGHHLEEDILCSHPQPLYVVVGLADRYV